MENYTPVDELAKIHASLRTTFQSGVTRPLEWRRRQLHQLARFVRDNADALCQCLSLDLGKPRNEVLIGEIAPVLERSLICATKLEDWVGDSVVASHDWQKGWNPRVRKDPKGVVLIIAPWNYPVVLSLQPLYGAIAAGCCALLKPSEVAPHYANFLHDNLGKYLDPQCFKVALGDIPVITSMLRLKWDHIFYTGNSRIARVISHAAAEHLTPLTLELGGKSPVIIDPSADLSIAAKRILWGKLINSGQVCVAPDYVTAPKALVPELVHHLKRWHDEFFPDYGGELRSVEYGKIVSEQHFKRLKGLLTRTKGSIVMGGQSDGDTRKMELTVVTNVSHDDALLEGEIFGPILPIVSVDSIDHAISFIQNRDHPLVLYVFGTNKSIQKEVLERTTSGAVLFNDTISMLSLTEMPVGGVGESGYGRQSLKYCIDNFVYERGVADVPYTEEPSFSQRYPSSQKDASSVLKQLENIDIPEI